MSNKGVPQTLATRQKISLANKKDRLLINQKVKEYLESLKKDSFPTLTECAIYAGISEKRLILYEMETPENSEIRLMLDEIRDRQKLSLMKNGLNKNYDSKIVTLLLKAHHGLKEEPTQLTQTNIYNGLSPDILAEALALSRKNPPSSEKKTK